MRYAIALAAGVAAGHLAGSFWIKNNSSAANPQPFGVKWPALPGVPADYFPFTVAGVAAALLIARYAR